jgi:hypothetical protein
MCFSGVSMTVCAYDDYDDDDDGGSVPVWAIPIVLPTVVVGGMILQSRTKRSQSGSDEYSSNFVLSTSQDTKIGTESTTESEGTKRVRRSSYVHSSEKLESGKAVLDAIKESINNNGNGGTDT